MTAKDAAGKWLDEQGQPMPASVSIPEAATVSYDRDVDSRGREDMRPDTHRALFPDPDSEWRDGPLPDEPTWPRPPRSAAEALARAEASRAFWRAMMRAPYATTYRRKRRPFRTSDLLRGSHVGTLTCERCGAPFERTGTRGPVPGLCPKCRERSRNRPGR